MIWKNYWENPLGTDALKQVQRISNGKVLSEKDIENVVENIAHYISKEDSVLDVCCGNGLITSKIECKSMVGVDFSNALIETAKRKFHSTNIKYIEADALAIDQLFIQQFDKIILNFSFQYFTFSKGKNLISKMSALLEKNGVIFISDIPNKEKQNKLAGNGISKIKYYLKYYLGKEQTGKFWSEKELDSICKSLNLKGKFIKQPIHLPYSSYRFDYLITKK